MERLCARLLCEVQVNRTGRYGYSSPATTGLRSLDVAERPLFAVEAADRSRGDGRDASVTATNVARCWGLGQYLAKARLACRHMVQSRHPVRRFLKAWTPPALVKLARSTPSGAKPPSSKAQSERFHDNRGNDLATRTAHGPEFYDEVFESEDRWTLPYWKMQWYASWAVLSDRVQRSDRPKVLDMGCGPGHLGRMLVDQGVTDFVGFDFSAKRVEQAKLLVPECRFEVDDAYSTDLFATVDYNIVTCCEFLEHLDGDLEILDRIPSGTRLLGTVPNYDAQAHVRYFSSADEVVARYGAQFDGLRVDVIHNTGNGCEFLMDGIRR